MEIISRHKSFEMRSLFIAFKKTVLFQLMKAASKLRSVAFLKQWIVSHKVVISRHSAFFQILFRMKMEQAMDCLYLWREFALKTREGNQLLGKRLRYHQEETTGP
eukprot:756065-Hanusia_phi.AAC.1